MKIENSKFSGFSLVELLVVISIVAVLSISSIVGFGYLGDILKAKEVTGFLSDLIKQEELKVLRGDFDKATIHFLPYYVVIEEQVPDAALQLKLKNPCGTEAPIGYRDQYEIYYGQDANLTQKDGEGETLEITSITGNTEDCIDDFRDSAEVEWNYQLSEGGDASAIVRFIHFNLQRENLGNPISITGGYGSRVEITAPYGKRLVYSPNDQLIDSPNHPDYPVTLTVQDQEQNSSDTLPLQ